MPWWSISFFTHEGTLNVISCLSGYVVSLLLGHFATAKLTGYLWKIADKEVRSSNAATQQLPPIRSSKKIAIWHGTAERFVYTTTLLLGRPEGVAVWLAYKAVMRWKIYGDDPRHIPGSAIYVVGTVSSLTFGVLGGLIATRSWTL